MLSPSLFLAQAAAAGQVHPASPAVTGGTSLAVTAAVLVASHLAYRRLLRNSPRPPTSAPRGAMPLVLTSSIALHAILWKHAELGRASESALRRARIAWNESAAPSFPKDPVLVTEALNALKRWKEDGSQGDLEGFILRVATRFHRPRLSEKEITTFLSDWKTYLAEQKSHIEHSDPIETIAQAKTRFENFREQIVSDFPNYLLPQWNLVTLFKKKRGNCDARTNLMLAAFSAIALPPHLVLAIEHFGETSLGDGIGHAQPVLYDLKTGEYWNLWSNTVRSKSRGDIYHGVVLYHAFLVKQRTVPPVSVQDLLITKTADPYDRPANETSQWKERLKPNSPFGFPRSNAYYPAGSPNEGDPINEAPIEDIFSQKEIEALRHSFPELPWEYKVFQKDGNELLIFKDKAKETHYKGLRFWEEKRDYLLSLFEASLRRYVADQKFQELLRLLEHPYVRLPRASGEELQRAVQTFDGYGPLYSAAVDALGYSLSKSRKNRGEEVDQMELATRAKQSLPESRRLDVYLQGIEASIAKDPGPFFLMLNEIKGLEGKRAAIQLATQSERDSTLSEFLEDESKIGIAGKSEKAAPYRPPSVPHDFFEIAWQTPEWDLPDEEKTDKETATGDGNPPVPKQEASVQIKVSAETLIDSILLLRSIQRWTVDLAQAYGGLSNLERDRAFVKIVVRYFDSELATPEELERLRTHPEEFPPEQLASRLASLVTGKFPNKEMVPIFEDILRKRGASFVASLIKESIIN